MPLPIELLNFDAKLVGDEVICNWSTATEINTDYFVIQRTIDGVNFENIDSILAAETSYETLHYNLSDPNPLLGTSYYRLKQYDLDGSSETFPLSEVKYRNLEVKVNQQGENLQVTLPSNVKGTVQIIDMMGRIVFEENEGTYFELNTDNLPKGSYFLIVVTNNDIYNKQLNLL